MSSTSALYLTRESPLTSTSSPLPDSTHHHLPTHQKASVSTQTMDTAFALCIRCSETQDTLIDVADSMSTLCQEQGQQSSMAKTDWRALAKVDGMDVGLWRKSLKMDLGCVGDYCSQLRATIGELEKERDSHKMTVGRLESEIEQLSRQMDSLQVVESTLCTVCRQYTIAQRYILPF